MFYLSKSKDYPLDHFNAIRKIMLWFYKHNGTFSFYHSFRNIKSFCSCIIEFFLVFAKFIAVCFLSAYWNCFFTTCRWYTMVHADGSVVQTWNFFKQHGLQGLIEIWPRPTATAWYIIFIYGAFEAALQLFLPGKRVEGPISPTGNRPVYKVWVTWCCFTEMLINSFASPLICLVVFFTFLSPKWNYEHLNRNVYNYLIA